MVGLTRLHVDARLIILHLSVGVFNATMQQQQAEEMRMFVSKIAIVKILPGRAAWSSL
jgi:hypothetical protein